MRRESLTFRRDHFLRDGHVFLRAPLAISLSHGVRSCRSRLNADDGCEGEPGQTAQTQTGEALSVLMYLGDGFQTVPAPIAGDGSSAFAGRTSYTEEGVTLTLDSAWQITRPGSVP